MTRHAVILYWSEADGAYLAEVPELAGCVAHGATLEEALRSVQEAAGLWVETALAFGDPIPGVGGRFEVRQA
jgi:predicted RNase H-like HicB family nuclease